MKKVKILFHVGYGKTGTTWVQRQVYPKLNNCFYFGKLDNNSMINDELHKTHYNLFNPLFSVKHYRGRNSEALINEYSKLFIAELAQRFSDTNDIVSSVLSCESVLDYANFNAELNIFLLYRLLKRLKESLADICEPEISILVTFREQSSFLQSFYSFEYSKQKRRFPTFEKFLDYGLQNHHDLFFGGLWYDEVYQSLIDVFKVIGVEVIFVPYELLVEDPAFFLEKSIGHLGNTDLNRLAEVASEKKENANQHTDGAHNLRDISCVERYARYLTLIYKDSVPEKYLIYLKSIRIWFTKPFQDPVIKGVIKLSDDQTKSIRGLFRDSNSRLSNLISMDLGRLGYSVKDGRK
jgi:hypothetical protein